MEIFYYRDPKLNFGDDLNGVLWKHILSSELLEAEDVVLIGIGSILSQEWVGKFAGSKKKIIVLGSGTSYDLSPSNLSNWSVLAVRGPFTAAAIGMPDKAVTDGAILLADAPALIGSPQPRTDIIFMPHHRSIRTSPWKSIAESAGMRFVTPQQPVADVLAAFAQAKLVITEAMHGAIVADTLRIPWIPVIISPAVDEFKWRDWCTSMDLPFLPQALPAGAADDARHFGKIQSILVGSGVGGHRNLEGAVGRSDLEAYLRRRFAPTTKSALLKVVAEGRLRRLANRPYRLINPLHRAKAAQALRRIASGQAFLSHQSVFTAKLQQMREAVRSAESVVVLRRAAD